VPELQEPLPELRGEGVVLRPLEAAHVEGLRAIRQKPEVSDWWGEPEDDFPLDDEPTAARYTIFVDEQVAGMVQFNEENEPDYRNAEVDIFLDPDLHSRGHGTDSMLTLAAYLTAVRGHHRLVLGTSTDNAAALRCYEKAGFRRVGITRSSGRDFRTGEWGDEWFMELVVLPG